MQLLIDKLQGEFAMTDLLRYFPGIDASYLPEGLLLSHRKIHHGFSMPCCKLVKTPSSPNTKLNLTDGSLFPLAGIFGNN